MNKLWAPCWILCCLSLVSACGNRPEPNADVEAVCSPDFAAAKARAVWIATSDFQSHGWLGRFDLENCRLDRRVRSVGSDVLLAADGPDSFFLLTRTNGDSITIFRGSTAVPEATYVLPPRVNAQHAARDGLGRVWVAGMESNTVEVLSPDLRRRIGGVDLSSLRDSADNLAEPYALASLGNGLMGIATARLERPSWRPNPQGGAALVDETTLALKETRLLNVANPVHAFARNGSLVLIGAGSQAANVAMVGGIETMNPGSLVPAAVEHFSRRLIHADIGPTGELATVEWEPERKRTCVRHAGRVLACDGHTAVEGGDGYVFSRVLVAGEMIFIAYAKDGNSELWLVPARGGAIQRLPMSQPIQAFVLGP